MLALKRVPETLVVGLFFLGSWFNPLLAAPSIGRNHLVCLSIKTLIPPTGGCAQHYTVQRGDSCSSISGNNDTQVLAMRAYNPGVCCDNLLKGTQLCTLAPPNTTATPSNPHCLAKTNIIDGAYCYNIAEQYALTVPELLSLNPDMDCSTLTLGQDVCVLDSILIQQRLMVEDAFEEVCILSHTISPGDTCYDVAQASNITLTSLRRMNPYVNCPSLQIGSTLCLNVEKMRHVLVGNESLVDSSQSLLNVTATTSSVANASQTSSNQTAQTPSATLTKKGSSSFTSMLHRSSPSPSAAQLPPVKPSPNQGRRPNNSRGPGPRAQDHASHPASTSSPPSNSFETSALSSHNQARSSMGIPPLQWDHDLARQASDYSVNLVSRGCPPHGHSPAHQRPGQGENLDTIFNASDLTAPEAVNIWMAEGYTPTYNHYTQVMWKDTKRLGCGKAARNGCAVIVCRYFPAGNVVGQHPY